MNINPTNRKKFLSAFFFLATAVFLPVSCRAQIASKSPEPKEVTKENSALQNCPEAKDESNEPPAWKESALHKAILSLDIKTVKKLLAENSSVDEIAAYGDTALILSLSPRIPEAKPVSIEQRKREVAKEKKFRLEAVKELLKYKADVNKKGFGGLTPLIELVRRNYDTPQQLKILNILIENKADVNLQDNRGMTALMWAAENGNAEVVSFLLEHGANRNLKNCEGQTALLIARSTNKVEIIKILEITN